MFQEEVVKMVEGGKLSILCMIEFDDLLIIRQLGGQDSTCIDNFNVYR